jgi:DNA-directed RNA polymerase subunit RPC12/RpoP
MRTWTNQGKQKEVDAMKDIVFQSGDDISTDLACYNCGTPFADSAKEKGITAGSVVCTCGGRIAYVVEPE